MLRLLILLHVGRIAHERLIHLHVLCSLKLRLRRLGAPSLFVRRAGRAAAIMRGQRCHSSGATCLAGQETIGLIRAVATLAMGGRGIDLC